MLPWKAAPAGGGAPRGTLSPFPLTMTAPPSSLEEEQQQDEVAAALAISDRRTLYLVNIFIGSTARFLNSFAAVCEDKLADVHRRILRLDSTLRLLEAKLSGTSSCGDGEPEQDQRHGASSSPPPAASSSASTPSDQLGMSSTNPSTGC